MKLILKSCIRCWQTASSVQCSQSTFSIITVLSWMPPESRKDQNEAIIAIFFIVQQSLQQHVILMLNRVLFTRTFKLHWVDFRVEFRTFGFLNYTQWNCVWRSGWFIRPSMYCWLIYILGIIVIQTLTAKLSNEQLHRVENRNSTRWLTRWFSSLYLHVYAVILIDAYIVYATVCMYCIPFHKI